MPRQRHRQHGNPFNVRGEIALPDWPAVFARSAPFALDIGCGAGSFTVELARRHPEWNVVGLEIRDHWVDGVRAAARAEGLGNLYAVLANANLHLDLLVPDGSVAFVAVNFPDPWFKKRHHKRRVVRPELMEVLGRKAAPGAELHAMSDFAPIAEEIAAVVEAAGWHNLAGRGAFAAESTTGISSERERSHLRRGAAVFRLHFRRP